MTTMARRNSPRPDDTVADADDQVPVSSPPKSGQETLAEIRANATARMADHAHSVAHTIADLEAWRAEIDATIAFLKAQRR
jgi:hypothetical protein